MSFTLRSVWFLLGCCFLLAPSRKLNALDLSIDSFYTEQHLVTTSPGVLTQDTRPAVALGGIRTVTGIIESSTGSASLSITGHALEAQISDDARGLISILWDADRGRSNSLSNVLNGTISVPRCEALLVDVRSFTKERGSGTIGVRLYDPFSKGARFFQGKIDLSDTLETVTKTIPLSAMTLMGSHKDGSDFPVGPITITMDRSVVLSSVRLRCPSDAFVDIESSNIDSAQGFRPAKNRTVGRSAVRQPPVQDTRTAAATATPVPPLAVCGDGIIQAGEECDPGTSNMGGSCVNCSVQCIAAAQGKGGAKTLGKSGKARPECAPPPTCAAPYKSCSQPTKRGGSACCYDPKTEDCITFTTWGHPVARCVPKSGGCQDPDGKECRSSKGDRACCPSTPEASCAQGGGIAFCSFSACGPNQTACKTATGMRSEATMCCSNDTEQCKTTIEILGYLIQTCIANETACVNSGGTLCTGNGTPRCCAAGTVCSSSVDGFPNCVDEKRTAQSEGPSEL